MLFTPHITSIPQIFLVDGGKYARTPAGIAAACADAQTAAAGGKSACVTIIPGAPIAWDTTQIVITVSNVTVQAWPGTRVQINLPASAAVVNPFIFSGTGLGAARSLSANGSMLDNNITLVAGSVGALGLADDDLILITDNRPSYMTARILSIAGETLQLSDDLGESFTTARAAQVQKYINPLVNCHMRGININANSNTGLGTVGVIWQYITQCSMQECDSYGLGNSDTQAFMYALYGYLNTWQDMNARRSGTLNLPDMSFGFETRSYVHNLKSDMSPGFGPGFSGNQWCVVDAVNVGRARYRAIKWSYCAWTAINNCLVTSTTTHSGISLTLYTHDCMLNSNISTGGVGDGDLMINGDNNQINGGYYEKISIAAPVVGAPAPDNTRINARYATLVDFGTNTKILAWP